MNCSKCGSPLNPGDKFCQVCGSAVEQTTNPAMPQPIPPVGPEVPAAPQPMPAPTPVSQPPVAPEEPKKGNTLVVLLVAIIAILVVVIVAILFLGKDKDNSGNGSNSNGETPAVAKVDTPQYNEVKLGGYNFKLLPGYSVESSAQGVVLTNTAGTVQALFGHFDGHKLSEIDCVGLQTQFKSMGFESTYKETTVEGKKGILFTGTYSGFDYEVLYVEDTSSNRIIYADLMYMTPEIKTSEADNLHKMVALTTVIDQTTQAQTKPFGNFSSIGIK